MNSRLLCNVSEHIEVTLDQIFLKQFHEFYSFLCGQHNNTCNQYNQLLIVERTSLNMQKNLEMLKLVANLNTQKSQRQSGDFNWGKSFVCLDLMRKIINKCYLFTFILKNLEDKFFFQNITIAYSILQRMNFKIFASLSVLTLGCLLVKTASSQLTQANLLSKEPQNNRHFFRFLNDSQMISYGNSIIIDTTDPHFQSNQRIYLFVQLKNHSQLLHPVSYKPERPRIILEINKKQISVITISDCQELDQNQSKARLMQTLNTDSSFLTYIIYVFEILLAASRNLILVGLIFNLLDTFLPYIILCQSFVMFGLFNADQHYLNVFFYNILNSKIDLMTAMRLALSPGSDADTLPPLRQYNLASNIFFNITGQFLVTIIFLAITVLISLFAVCCSSERFRTAKTKLHPLWNGFFMGLFPRLATYAGFQFRIIFNDGVNGFLGSVLGLIFVAFFIQLFVQTKRVKSKVQYIQETKLEIGLASRIDYKKNFEFDCLQYSMLYYPVMNYLRLMFFFLPIGAAYDLYYVSFGGPILSQLFMMMIEVSSPGYTKKKDRFLYPLNNFLLLNIQLCIITVVLAQSVSHPEVSQITETVLFGIAIFVYFTSLVSMVADTVEELRNRCCVEAVKLDHVDEESSQKFVRQVTKLQSDIDENFKKTQKSDDMDDFQGDEIENHRYGFQKETCRNKKLKIRKVKGGKII